MKYLLRDESGQLMRVVGRLEEAKNLISCRPGWTYQRVTEAKPKYQFEEAPF